MNDTYGMAGSGPERISRTIGVPDGRIQLRSMSHDDVAAVHRLSRAEQWPHRCEDLSGLFALGSGLVAEIGGTIVATTMWWPCGEDMTSLGIVIVARTHRGAGLGRIIVEAALERIGERSVILNATEDGLRLYRKLGFNGIAEQFQHQGVALAAPSVPLDPGARIRPLDANDDRRVEALVEAATGLRRPKAMAALLETGHGLVLDCDGALTGFALSRRFGHGYVIGPVVALDLERAKALVAQCLGMRGGEFTRLDIVGGNTLGEWLNDLGIARVSRVVTMARGRLPVPTGDLHSFAIASQALC